ncbi:MAG: potassium/proton antiporter [Leptothrix sp. (in: b-proteobacteria)]
MDFINAPLLAAATLVFASLLAGMLSARIGFSFLLVFLIAGMLAGEDGPGGWLFGDFRLSFWVGNVALAVILLDGGLRTSFVTFRTGLKPSLLLATLGVLLSALLTGCAAMWLLDLDWRLGLLLGAIVGSTDAAAVFALLKRSGVTLNERVAATLEIESGMNDPMAVFLTLSCIGLIVGTEPGGAVGAATLQGLLVSLALQFGLGSAAGLLAGALLAGLLRRLPAPGGAVLALLLVSGGLGLFALTGLLHGSGFLAIYLFGMVLANRAGEGVRAALDAMDGYAWLAQAIMFLLLGLLVTPSSVLQIAGPALGIAAVLMLLARPAAVWLCLAPQRFEAREVWFIAWVGLRGAVPIVLAIFPLMAGVAGAMSLFNAAFVVVLISLLLQGSTIGWAARRLGVVLPEAGDEVRRRAVFGDFVLDAEAPVGALFGFYGLGEPEHPELQLADWLADALGRPPVVGDQFEIGPVRLSVRAMNDARIALVGLQFDESAD